MQIDEAGVAGGLRIAVGHADHARFLQAQHVIDVIGPVRQERQFGRAGIAEHFFDAEGAQEVEGRLLDGDRPAALFGDVHHVAVPFMVGWPSAFAVQSSMPLPLSLALTENSAAFEQRLHAAVAEPHGGVPPCSFAASSTMNAACSGPWKIRPG